MKRLVLLLVVLNIFCGSLYAVDFWVKTDSVANSAIISMAVNPVNGKMLAVADGLGVYRSTSKGTNWTAVNTGLPNKMTRCVVYNSSGTAFCGLNGSGVFTSTNDGDTWTEANSGITNKNMLTLSVDSKGTLFAGSWFYGTVFMSTNNGSSWSDIGPAKNDIHSVYSNGKGTIFAGTDNNGLMMTTDGGQSWKTVGIYSTIINSITSDASGALFAGATNGFYISKDNGSTWNKSQKGLTSTLVRNLMISSAGNLFAATAGGVFRSGDHGYGWENINKGLDTSDLNAFSLAVGKDAEIYTGTYVNVYRSDLADGVGESLTGDLEITSYPVPSYGKVNFDLNLEKDNFTTLTIYDVMGNLVGNVCNTFLAAGIYHFEFIPGSIPSGIYYFRLQTGREIKTGKIVYMK